MVSEDLKNLYDLALTGWLSGTPGFPPEMDYKAEGFSTEDVLDDCKICFRYSYLNKPHNYRRRDKFKFWLTANPGPGV